MSGSLFPLAMARLVLKMLGGELIPYTKFDGLIANRLMDEGIITIVPRGSKRSFRMIDPEGCVSTSPRIILPAWSWKIGLR